MPDHTEAQTMRVSTVRGARRMHTTLSAMRILVACAALSVYGCTKMTSSVSAQRCGVGPADSRW